jgi:hypothetical protein
MVEGTACHVSSDILVFDIAETRLVLASAGWQRTVFGTFPTSHAIEAREFLLQWPFLKDSPLSQFSSAERLICPFLGVFNFSSRFFLITAKRPNLMMRGWALASHRRQTRVKAHLSQCS